MHGAIKVATPFSTALTHARSSLAAGLASGAPAVLDVSLFLPDPCILWETCRDSSFDAMNKLTGIEEVEHHEDADTTAAQAGDAGTQPGTGQG